MLFDLDLGPRYFAQMLRDALAHSPALRDSDVVVPAAFGLNPVDDRLIVGELLSRPTTQPCDGKAVSDEGLRIGW